MLTSEQLSLIEEIKDAELNPYSRVSSEQIERMKERVRKIERSN